jgi:hypothetical protein
LIQNKEGDNKNLSLIATELKKGENRGGKNCHDETMINTKS